MLGEELQLDNVDMHRYGLNKDRWTFTEGNIALLERKCSDWCLVDSWLEQTKKQAVGFRRMWFLIIRTAAPEHRHSRVKLTRLLTPS
jgi:hypothetical protein